jgi:hypothetical protein
LVFLEIWKNEKLSFLTKNNANFYKDREREA